MPPALDAGGRRPVRPPPARHWGKQNLFQINSEIFISRMFVQWIVV